MPIEVDDLLQELDHTWEARRSVTQDTANKATDVLVRQKQREQALESNVNEEELKQKYGLDRM